MPDFSVLIASIAKQQTLPAGVVQAVGDFLETFGGPLSPLGRKLNDAFVPERNKQETFARDVAAGHTTLMTGPVVSGASKAANAGLHFQALLISLVN